MRSYELMCILPPDLEEEASQELVGRIQEMITHQGGEVTNLNDMGKRRLAYEIQKYREGHYVVINFTAQPSLIAELDRNLRINDNVIRHLIVRDDE